MYSHYPSSIPLPTPVIDHPPPILHPSILCHSSVHPQSRLLPINQLSHISIFIFYPPIAGPLSILHPSSVHPLSIHPPFIRSSIIHLSSPYPQYVSSASAYPFSVSTFHPSSVHPQFIHLSLIYPSSFQPQYSICVPHFSAQIMIHAHQHYVKHPCARRLYHIHKTLHSRQQPLSVQPRSRSVAATQPPLRRCCQ